MAYPQYFARTANDGTVMYLIRVDGPKLSADIYHVPTGTWVRAPDQEGTLDLCAPWSTDVDRIRAEDLPAMIEQLRG